MKNIRIIMIRERIEDILFCKYLDVDMKEKIVLVLEQNINHILMI